MRCKTAFLATLSTLVVLANPAATAQDCVGCGNAGAQSRFSQSTALDGGWRLVKSRNPDGNGEIVSLMRAVDTAKSDIALAGLSLRCGPVRPEVVLILLDPIPSTERPVVTLQAGPTRTRAEASAQQGGQTLVLSQAALPLANAARQGASEVAVTIETRPNPITGVVPLSGLVNALSSLSVYCPVK
jgi:hypothetical protein